jgi:serpin B
MVVVVPSARGAALVRFVVSAVVACGSVFAQDPAPGAPPAPKTADGGSSTGCLPPGGASAALALNDFGFALHRALRQDGGNLVVSPWSVAEAFLFVRGSTTGELRDEVNAAFRWRLPDDGDDRGAVELRRAMTPKDGPLRAANRLWLHTAAHYREDAVAKLDRLHGSGVARLDFAAAEASRRTINEWVAERTEHKIPELLPAGVVDGSVRLVVTNAIYFRDAWANAFDAKKTKPTPFRPEGAAAVDVPMMDARRNVRFLSDATGTYVELPFRGEAFSFFAAMPPEGASLAAFEDRFDAAGFAKIRAALREEKDLRVRLPRFKLAADLKLHEKGLPELGLKRAFAPSTDWSPLVGADPLFIAYVGHQAVIEVDEQGAEAAAATVVVVKRGGAPKKRPEFFADRPFLFSIVHRASGAAVFVGRYARPS